jgi:CheY-like chemotaxis protein
LLRAPSEGDDEGSPFFPLATARRLTAAHGGVLVEWAETPTLWSAPAYLPLEQLDGGLEQPLSRRLDVLAVEDNPGARALLRVAIEALGHRPTLCASGADALEMVQQRGFDVILMDLSMPGLSGCDTARRIRALPLPWAQAPIAALTASSTPGVREEIAEAGMDAFLRKPIDIPQLAETLALLAERSVQAAEANQVQPKDEHQEAEDQQNRRGGEERNDLFHADSDSIRRAAL